LEKGRGGLLPEREIVISPFDYPVVRGETGTMRNKPWRCKINWCNWLGWKLAKTRRQDTKSHGRGRELSRVKSRVGDGCGKSHNVPQQASFWQRPRVALGGGCKTASIGGERGRIFEIRGIENVFQGEGLSISERKGNWQGGVNRKGERIMVCRGSPAGFSSSLKKKGF